MGLATFAFRKSSLVWSINNLEYQLMCITNRLQVLAETSSALYNSSMADIMAAQDPSGNNTTDTTGVSLFEANLARIHALEKPLELQKERIETQLTAKQNELESIEKGEENAAKRQTPKFA
ncbi:MAG: hypothetical protein PHV68_03125 [Candidatus Gastranaerophilales bacterium]|nr:hypothetical protein [Candidatus Gastranaerophilales bacterium]